MTDPVGQDRQPVAAGGSTRAPAWWRSAVFYQIYPRSFADGNADGIGDLSGVTSRLDYLHDLGVDALWLSPFYRSPMADGGYDVSDPCDVDPIFGTLGDFDRMVAGAHQRGIRVTIDIVPNHFSDQHPWFQAALAAGSGSPERERFIFRDGRGEHGDLPPNNWPSAFGGPAWTRVTGADGDGDGDDQWYLHLFAPEQPDVNWSNPEVSAEFERIMRFWLDRGVDGFRVDVANSMAKPPGLPDMSAELLAAVGTTRLSSSVDPRWDNDDVHRHLRRFRQTLDSYDGDRMAVGEAYISDPKRLARYVRADELNLTFNFHLIKAEWDAEQFRTAIDDSISAMAYVGAPCTWALANHDVPRKVTRYGDGAVGLARARAAALVQLSLPGAVYVYNGDELGLPNVDLPEWALQDPKWERSGYTEPGRDGERVPLPWSGHKPPFGFTAGENTWLPIPEEWADLTVEAQREDPQSTLALYRRAIALRAATPELCGRADSGTDDAFGWVPSPEGTLVYRRGPGFLAAVNFTRSATPLPRGMPLLASAPIGADGMLPPNSAVWLRPLP
jgi:alpha-glucosidase